VTDELLAATTAFAAASVLTAFGLGAMIPVMRRRAAAAERTMTLWKERHSAARAVVDGAWGG